MDRAGCVLLLLNASMSRLYRPNFKEQWKYAEELYKQRKEVERFFSRLKSFRRIFTHYDKLDSVFADFILFAMIIDSLV